MRGRDHQGLTNMSEDIDTRLTDEQKAATALLCCAWATDVGEANEFMLMLGVHPSFPVEDEVPEAYERLGSAS